MFNDDRIVSAHDFLFGSNCMCSGDTDWDEEERLETYNSILDRSHHKEPLGVYLDSDGVKRLLNRMYGWCDNMRKGNVPISSEMKKILNSIYGRENAMTMRQGYIYKSPKEKYEKCMVDEFEDHGTPRHSRLYPWGHAENKSVCLADPDRIIFNPPATIVFWKDGTKTVVKCAEGEKFDPYTGFCYAFTEHFLGSISHIKKLCRKSSTGLPEASESIVEEEKCDGPMSSFEKKSVAYMRRAICDKFSEGWNIDQIAKRFKMSDKDICEALGKEFE